MDHPIHRRVVLIKGTLLFLVLIGCITIDPDPILTAAPQSPGHLIACSINDAYDLYPISWIDHICTGRNHQSIKYLFEFIPYSRLCTRYDSATYRDELKVTPTPLSPLTVIPKAPPGTISVPSSGKALYIDQTLQAMRVFENGVEVRSIPVSTGLRMSYTPAFSGRISYYVKKISTFGSLSDHAWYFTQATGNIYIHSAPYTSVNGQKVYQGLEWLGVKPSSHGCVRIHPIDADWLLDWDPRGVQLNVTNPDFVKFPD